MQSAIRIKGVKNTLLAFNVQIKNVLKHYTKLTRWHTMRLLSPVRTSRLDAPSQWTATTDGRTFLTTVSTDRRYGCSVHTSRCAEKHCTTMFFFDGPSWWTIETAVKKYVRHNGPSRRSIVTVRQDGWCVRYWALQFINYNISLVCTVNST